MSGSATTPTHSLGILHARHEDTTKATVEIQQAVLVAVRKYELTSWETANILAVILTSWSKSEVLAERDKARG